MTDQFIPSFLTEFFRRRPSKLAQFFQYSRFRGRLVSKYQATVVLLGDVVEMVETRLKLFYSLNKEHSGIGFRGDKLYT